MDARHDGETTGTARAAPARSLAGDLAGALGDLGTLLPYALGAVTVAGMNAVGVFAGFGVFLVATGLFYGLPIAVQPMKAVGAVVLAGQLPPAQIVATGITVGLVMLVLGVTGFASKLARLVPQSVTTGLQLGLGLTMIAIGLRLMADMPFLAAASIALLVCLLRWPRAPAAAVVVAIGLGYGALQGASLPAAASGFTLPPLPSLAAFGDAFTVAVLPQLSLTLTNAVILTAVLSRELFPANSGRVSERNLSVSTGLANLLLCPLGALPMCHGAGGLQAQWRFGARSGLAPVALGLVLLALALCLGPRLVGAISILPMATLGALLAFAGADLATSKRLFDARPRCWPTIAVAAALTLFVDAAWGLAGGIAAEKLTDAVLRRRRSGPVRDRGA